MRQPNRLVLHVEAPASPNGIGQRLARQGYELAALTDVVDLLPRIVRDKIQVVLLDLDAVAADGLELLRQIKAYDSSVQVLVLSGMVSQQTLTQARRFGAEALLLKPVEELKPLVGALDDAFRRIERWQQASDSLRERRRAVAPSFYSATLSAAGGTGVETPLPGLSA